MSWFPYIFGSYRCHTKGLTVNVVEDLAVEVDNIPVGCTGLCQLFDVGVNKPLKFSSSLGGAPGDENNGKGVDSC